VLSREESNLNEPVSMCRDDEVVDLDLFQKTEKFRVIDIEE